MDDPEPTPRQCMPLLADVGTLVELGVVEAPPRPPPDIPPEPPADEQANAAALDQALTDAGIPKAAADQDAIVVLAKLDPTIVEAITRWVHGDPAEPAAENPAQAEQ